MFMDSCRHPNTRAPEERNVSGDEYARSATFRSSGAGRISEGAFYKHCVPTGREI